MIDTLTNLLDWFEILVFATTGSLVASRKQMDIVGFLLLGTATGVGGGTLRDVLLGQLPVFWVVEPGYLIACVAVSAATFFLAHIPESRLAVVLRFDAIGMALFAVTGADKALALGVGPLVAVAMGVVTATFGGVLRDILGGESPVILSREIYVTAALAGAVTFVVMASLGGTRDFALVLGFLVAAAIRLGALQWDWTLPRYRPRSERAR